MALDKRASATSKERNVGVRLLNPFPYQKAQLIEAKSIPATASVFHYFETFLPGRYKSPKAPANKANKTPKTFIPLFVHGAIKTFLLLQEVPINNLQNVLSQKTATIMGL
jgi:hypothetical protein